MDGKSSACANSNYKNDSKNDSNYSPLWTQLSIHVNDSKNDSNYSPLWTQLSIHVDNSYVDPIYACVSCIHFIAGFVTVFFGLTNLPNKQTIQPRTCSEKTKVNASEEIYTVAMLLEGVDLASPNTSADGSPRLCWGEGGGISCSEVGWGWKENRNS